MIKRILQVGILLTGFVSVSAWAILINDAGAGANNGINVGFIDTFIGEGAKQGNPTSETTWVNGVLSGVTATFEVKNGPVPYFFTDSAGVFAFELGAADIDYFLIKNATRIALFENLADYGWGVFDSSSLSGSMNLPSSGYTISHVTQFSSDRVTTPPPPVSVSEPGLVGLLAMGLIAMGVARRLVKV